MLELRWGDNAESESQQNVEEQLKALEPHPNLEKLVIKNYYGTHLPPWMSDLKNIVDIELRNYKNYLKLPPLGHLPLLQRLIISGMEKVEYVDNNYPDGGPAKGFPSLEILVMHDLLSLRGLSRNEGKELLPVLRLLDISNCPNLSFQCLSSLKRSSVWGKCTNVVLESISNIVSLTSLVVRDNEETICFLGEVLANLTLLESQSIGGFTKLKLFPNGLASLGALKSLTILHCPKLKYLPEEGLRGIESLKFLEIWYCDEFNSLSEGLQYLTALEALMICGSPKLVALPEGIKHLKSLQRLTWSGSYPFEDLTMSEALPETLQHVPALQSLY